LPLSIIVHLLTKKKPNHKKCPPAGTPKSWCFFNNAKASKEKPKSHKEMSLKLSPLVVKKVQNVYTRLSGESLLERCSRAGTQNANESLHALVSTALSIFLDSKSKCF